MPDIRDKSADLAVLISCVAVTGDDIAHVALIAGQVGAAVLALPFEEVLAAHLCDALLAVLRYVWVVRLFLWCADGPSGGIAALIYTDYDGDDS